MNIQTKYEINDEVWYFNNQAPTRTEIKAVLITVRKTPRTNVIIKYEVLRNSTALHENALFGTQIELYSSLEEN